MRVPFIDLKAEYLSIKKDVDRTLAKVMRRGDFIIEYMARWLKNMMSYGD